MPRLRPGLLVLAILLFVFLAVGATGGVLLARYRSAAMAALVDRQRLMVELQARLVAAEFTRLQNEMVRLSRLAEVDLADNNMEPEKRVLQIAHRDTALFAVSIFILGPDGQILWEEPRGARLMADGAKVVEEAQGTGRAVFTAAPGEIAVGAAISGHGAIVGAVSARSRSLFGESLPSRLPPGSGAMLVDTARGEDEVIAATGVPLPRELRVADGGEAWLPDAHGRTWLVYETRFDEQPLALRVAVPRAAMAAEVAKPWRSLLAIVALALLVTVAGGALLAIAISRLEKAEVELSRSRDLAAMGKTAAAIAHEVKNSLNGLSIALDLLASGRTTPEVAGQVNGQARSEIARLRGVADDLTLFAAPPRLDPGEVDVAELCRRAAASCAHLAQDCGAEVALQLPGKGTELRIAGDSHKLLGALQNLVRNGLEATGPGAFGESLEGPVPARERRVTLVARQEGRTAVIDVCDTGAGIAPEVRGRLFEPFVSNKRTGTGLGLAIVRRVVEAHGGRVTALDRTGGGTIFRVELPIREDGHTERARAGEGA